jgi:hypothetical protein
MPESASSTTTSGAATPVGPWAVISWAAFLACSWTWCIGMWLPVILLRDFGPWSFAAFAIPNVVGAAAMGIVLSKRGLSEWLTTEHEFAARAFSVVTIAFQMFFALWLVGFGTGMEASLKLVAPLAALGVAALLLGFSYRWITQASVVLWLASFALVCVTLLPHRRAPALPPPTLGPDELVWLTPVMVLGFLLCPYLDLTFHRARRAVPGVGGSVAFVLGFGVLFLTMIAGSLGYGFELLTDHAAPLPRHLPALIMVHVAIQLAFTIVAHAQRDRAAGHHVSDVDRALATRGEMKRLGMRLGFFGVVGVGVVAAASRVSHADLTGMEILYRTFLAFYGLVFPAYVWICMIPFGSTRTQRRVLVFALAVALAAPFYWLGFIERLTIWLVPGVAIVLLAKAFAGSAPRRTA